MLWSRVGGLLTNTNPLFFNRFAVPFSGKKKKKAKIKKLSHSLLPVEILQILASRM